MSLEREIEEIVEQVLDDRDWSDVFDDTISEEVDRCVRDFDYSDEINCGVENFIRSTKGKNVLHEIFNAFMAERELHAHKPV